MALRVPQQHLPQIQSLLEFPDERIQLFLDALTNAGSKFNVYDLATDVSNRAKVPRRIAEGILQVLVSLYMTREREAVPLGKFLDEQVGPALRTALAVQDKAGDAKASTPTAEEVEERWARFKKFLMAALVLD